MGWRCGECTWAGECSCTCIVNGSPRQVIISHNEEFVSALCKHRSAPLYAIKQPRLIGPATSLYYALTLTLTPTMVRPRTFFDFALDNAPIGRSVSYTLEQPLHLLSPVQGHIRTLQRHSAQNIRKVGTSALSFPHSASYSSPLAFQLQGIMYWRKGHLFSLR